MDRGRAGRVHRVPQQNRRRERELRAGVFHNGYYGYKNWGIGLACLATWHENPRAPELYAKLLADYRARACPALEAAGEGGGWAEGHYVHYWIYEWLVFCEAAKRCAGADLYAPAAKFFGRRAVASCFEVYPGTAPNELNRPVPMGDGGYGVYGGYSEKILAARRMLASHYRDDPLHAFVAAYNKQIPGVCIPESYGYMNFLWHDPAQPAADLSGFKRSHYAAGAGWAAARSDWTGEATYFFFRCADRYTAHQHLDAGHFLIYKHAPLAGDGGVYDSFDSQHTANYYLRSIAHNTLLVHDPGETFPSGIRAAGAGFNDGGQAYPWCGTPMGHNGGLGDLDDLAPNKPLHDLADFLAFEDRGAFVHAAADFTRAYSPAKLDLCTRQIVYLRPDTFVIFDRVRAKNPAFKKTWLLHALKPPAKDGARLVVTNGRGRLTVQTLLPAAPEVRLRQGADLYAYGGQTFAPSKSVEHVPECRVEVSPSAPSAEDFFLHVLTAGEASGAAPAAASFKDLGAAVEVSVAGATLRLEKNRIGGSVALPDGTRAPLSAGIEEQPGARPPSGPLSQGEGAAAPIPPRPPPLHPRRPRPAPARRRSRPPRRATRN
ncbi:MAG: heparinase II/III-family protein [Planctomycetota bacterium]|nr:heparinase II/III-family protein [Planctomycetota bacterium]